MVTAHGQALSSLPTYTLSLMLSVVELCKIPHQCGCVLAYIPSLVGVASVWAAILQKGYPRDVYRGYSLHNVEIILILKICIKAFMYARTT